jgi:hypothetical protein
MSRRANRKQALRTLRHASAVIQNRAGDSDAPPMVIVIDEATELLKGRTGRACRRELSRLVALGRSENVTALSRTEGQS